MGLISSKQIDFSDGISGGTDITGSITISGSLTLTGDASASVAYISSSGAVVGQSGSFDYINITGNLSVTNITGTSASFAHMDLTGDLSVNDVVISGNITTALSASSYVYVDSNQTLNTITPTDGQLFYYTGSQFVASNILDGGSY